MNIKNSEIKKIIANPNKSEIIKNGHELRRKLLKAIENCNTDNYKEIKDTFIKHIENDDFDLMKRVEGDPIRGYKNFLISHNSLYAYSAEIGGMNPVLSHYLSEKYAILIESKKTINELKELHEYILNDYLDPANRISIYDNESLSAKVIYYVAINFRNKININNIADKFFVTRVHLMRTFKKETGMTINELIIQKRLYEACDMLKNRDLTITEIALMVGFSSSQYFSRIFHKRFGMNPKDYKNKKEV